MDQSKTMLTGQPCQLLYCLPIDVEGQQGFVLCLIDSIKGSAIDQNLRIKREY